MDTRPEIWPRNEQQAVTTTVIHLRMNRHTLRVVMRLRVCLWDSFFFIAMLRWMSTVTVNGEHLFSVLKVFRMVKISSHQVLKMQRLTLKPNLTDGLS